MEWVVPGSAELWNSALIGVPIALACGILGRLLPLRPATRHTLWVAALLGFVLPIVLPSAASLEVARHLPNFPSVDFPHGALVTPDRDETVAADPEELETVGADVFSESGDSDQSIFASAPNLPSDAGHAPETASTLRGDGPAASESAHEAAPPSTPRAVLEFANTRQSSEPVTPAYAGEDSARASRSEDTLANPNDGDTRVPVVTGFASDAPGRRSVPIDKPAAIDPREIAVALQSWLTAVGAIIVTALRGLARLPTIPASAWLSGIGVVALVQLVRLWRFRRRLAKALPAPSVVRRMVDDVSKEIGLSSAPETLLVDARISPLIWWGRAPTLVIPSRLWAQLDKHGRRAILCHELAHLRRRDHWIIWLEQAVGLAYWWNPLVWWVRKRIQEEADLACDAWVTWLMPRDRRAYAEALLRTRQFLNSSRADVPVGGMAAASGRARDFARRLTMVMTRCERPRRSLTGFVLAAAVISLGWATSPAWSCPDGNKAKVKKAKMTPAATCQTTTECKEGVAPTVISIPYGQGGAVSCTTNDGAKVMTVPAGAAPLAVVGGQGGVSALAPVTTDNIGVRFYGQGLGAMAGRAGQSPTVYSAGVTPSGNLSTSIYSMAGQSATPFGSYVINAQQQDEGDGDEDLEKRLAKLEKEISKLSKELKEGKATRRSRPAASPVAPAPPTAPRAAQGARSGLFRPDASGSGEVVIKSYALPSGKLDALYNFMVRDDVPIRVRKDGDKLEVHATAGQHEIIKAFLDIVHPEGGKAGMRSPTTTLRRAVAKADDQDVKRRVEKALAKLNSGGDVKRAMKDALAARELLTAKEARSLKPRVAEQLRALTERARATVHAKQSEIQSMQANAEAMAKQAEEITRQAAEMMAAAEAAAKDAVAGSEKTMEARQREVERAARELEKRARELEKQAEKLERKKSEIEDSSEESSSLAEELSELAEAVESDDELAAIEIDGLDEAIDIATENIEVGPIDVPEIELPEIDIVVPPTTPEPQEPEAVSPPAEAPRTPAPPTDAPATPLPTARVGR